MRKDRFHARRKSSHSEAASCGQSTRLGAVEELGLRPTVFYRWQKELFENGAAAFRPQERPQCHAEEKQKRSRAGSEVGRGEGTAEE